MATGVADVGSFADAVPTAVPTTSSEQQPAGMVVPATVVQEDGALDQPTVDFSIQEAAVAEAPSEAPEAAPLESPPPPIPDAPVRAALTPHERWAQLAVPAACLKPGVVPTGAESSPPHSCQPWQATDLFRCHLARWCARRCDRRARPV